MFGCACVLYSEGMSGQLQYKTFYVQVSFLSLCNLLNSSVLQGYLSIPAVHHNVTRVNVTFVDLLIETSIQDKAYRSLL